jgi:hypothetical protein
MGREFIFGYGSFDLSPDGGIDAMNYQILGSIFGQINNQIQNTNSQEFAFTGNVKAEDSMRDYYLNDRWGINVANSLMANPVVNYRL